MAGVPRVSGPGWLLSTFNRDPSFGGSPVAVVTSGLRDDARVALEELIQRAYGDARETIVPLERPSATQNARTGLFRYYPDTKRGFTKPYGEPTSYGRVRLRRAASVPVV